MVQSLFYTTFFHKNITRTFDHTMNFTIKQIYIHSTLLVLQSFIDKILISDKITSVILLNAEKSTDCIDVLLASKYAEQMPFLIFNYRIVDQNKLPTEWKIGDKTLVVRLTTLKKKYILNAFERFERNSKWKYLIIGSSEKNIGKYLDFYDMWNTVILELKRGTFFLLKNGNCTWNKYTREKLNNFDKISNLYDNLFGARSFEGCSKNMYLSYSSNFLAPQVVQVIGMSTNLKAAFGTDIYLTDLIAKTLKINSISATLDIYEKYTSFETTYKDFMQNDVVLIDNNIGNLTIVQISSTNHDTIYEWIDTYPYGRNKLVFLVPNDYRDVSILFTLVIKSPIVNTWLVVIVLFSVTRILIQQKQKRKNVMLIIMDTYSVTFTGIGFIKVTNRPEKILILSLSICFFVSSIICTGFLFNKCILTHKQQAISSIEDLNRSNLDIFVEYHYYSTALETHLKGL